MSRFATLIYKDWRMNRAIVIGAFVLVPITLYVATMTQPWRPGPWPLWKSMLNSLTLQGRTVVYVAAIIMGNRACRSSGAIGRPSFCPSCRHRGSRWSRANCCCRSGSSPP